MTTAHDLTPIVGVDLQERLAELVGQPFSGARTSYGDELRLTFGVTPERGSRWELGTRAAKWLLLDDAGVLARDTDGPKGVLAFGELGGSSIAAVDASRPDRTLAVVLDSGHRFVLMPNKPHRSKDDLDLWELFTPHGWWLAVRRDGSIEVIADAMPLTERKRRRAAA